MNSEARRRLHIPYADLAEGTRFQLVNLVMDGAIPGSEVFRKVCPILAIRERDEEIVIIRPETQTELIKS